MSVLGGVTGLASGLDTDAVVSKLMAVERQPEVRMQQNQRRAEARQALLKDVASRLRTLRAAASDLRSPGLWAPGQAVASSDPARVAVVRTGVAAAMPHTLAVQAVATPEQRTYAYTPPAAPFQLTVGTATIDLDAGATVEAVRDAINGRPDASASASVSGGQLVLTARATGAASTLAVSGPPELAEDPAKRLAGADAAYTLDGSARTSSSNHLADAVPGLDITLLGPTSSPAMITVTAPASDADAIKTKVKAFVEAYNATVDFVQTKLTEQRVANPTNQAEANKGQLRGDSALTGLLSRLRTTLSQGFAGNAASVDELRDIGVGTPTATGAFSRDGVQGKLVVDDGKLTAALALDPQGVRGLLGGVAGRSGFAQAVEEAVDPLASPGGLLDLRAEEASAQAKRFAGSITAMEQRLALKEKRLRSTFTAMEQALAASQAQAARLQGQL